MVEYTLDLNLVFQSLADATRRDILKRVIAQPRSISELAGAYSFSFAAIAKHIGVLEMAHLVTKHRQGRQQIIRANPAAISSAASHLQEYEALWNSRLDNLDQLVLAEQDSD